MAVNRLRADAPGVANEWRAIPAGMVVGSIMNLTISNKTLAATATDTSVSAIVARWISLRQSTNFPEWQEVTMTPYIDALGIIRGLKMTGPSDGTPIDVTQSTTAAPITVVVTTIQNGSAGKNNIQRIALQNTPTGGTFTLNYNGSVTAAIAYNASNATIQTALEGLTGIGAGNVTVTGATGLWYAEFISARAQTQMNLLVGDGASLTGSCSVFAQTTTPGKTTTNYIQKISEISTGGLSLTLSVSLNGTVAPPSLSVTASLSASYLESVLAGYVGAPNVHVTKGTEYNSQSELNTIYFLVEWMGIYGGDDNAKLILANTTGQGELSDSQTPSAGVSEVQLVRLLGGPTGGTFTLSFKGSTTAGIAYNASSGTVQTAFTGLASVGASNATVTGDSTAGYVVTFAATLGLSDQPLITGSGSSLTGGSFYISHYQNAVTQTNEKQQITFSSTPSSGNYTLTYSGATTANIAYNDVAATLVTRLEALANIAAGEVTVTGDYTTAFIVEFLLALGGTNLVEMTGTNVSLAGPGLQSITLTETQAETGPHHWDNPLNWSLGAIPVDGDTVILDGDVQIKYGLAQSGVDPTNIIALSTFTGGLGLSDWNSNGYYEYRTKDLSIGTAATLVPVIIGEGEGPGCSIFRVNFGSAYPNTRILKTARTNDTPAVLFRGGATGTGNRIELLRGSLGYCFGEGETGTIKNLVVGFVDNKDGDATYFLGSGATVTQITQNGGFGLALCTGHKVKMLDGFFAQERSGWTIAELILEGGNMTMIGSGTVSGTPAISGEAILELLASDQNISFANPPKIHGDNADILDPNSRAIITAQTYMKRDYVNTTRFDGIARNRRITDEAIP